MERREFLKAGTMAVGAPFLFGGCRSFCGSSKINVAVIGCGRISTEFEVPGGDRPRRAADFTYLQNCG